MHGLNENAEIQRQLGKRPEHDKVFLCVRVGGVPLRVPRACSRVDVFLR